MPKMKSWKTDGTSIVVVNGSVDEKSCKNDVLGKGGGRTEVVRFCRCRDVVENICYNTYCKTTWMAICNIMLAT